MAQSLQKSENKFMPLFSVDSSSALVVSELSTPTTAAITATPDKIADTNPGRKGLTIYNPSSSTVYIDNDNGVSSTVHAFPLPAKGYYEMPLPIYIGEVWAVVASGTASLEVRELT